MTSISTSLVIVAVVSGLGLAGCSEKSFPESEIYTLYSSNYPTDVGRSGVATFDLANIPELNGQICQEAADLYQADFEKRKRENGWSANTKMRHWCEKGRFKK
jgi:hypothetical protein